MAIERGEIYFVNLNPVEGREQAGQRPVLVLSIDAINRRLQRYCFDACDFFIWLHWFRVAKSVGSMAFSRMR